MSIINQNWQFQKLPDVQINRIHTRDQLDIDTSCYETIDLPHTWYHEGGGYYGTVIYRKILPQMEASGKRIFLNFQAADRWCKVFVNGCYAGEHKGGYSSFTFDITACCIADRDTELEVLLDNRSWGEISPLAGDFTVFGGLYRDVNLIITDRLCFDRTYYGTSGLLANAGLNDRGQGVVAVDAHLLGTEETEAIELVYQILSPSGRIVAERCCSSGGSCRIKVADPILWNGMESPQMYHLHAQLKTAGEMTDMLDLSFGFRQMSLDAEQGFSLNQKQLKLNGVAMHQDYAGVYHATRQQQWQQNISDIIAIGANSVRLSHYQHPQEMYHLCDEKGLVVWAEIPLLKLTDSPALFENACSQLTELILQNIHHPSICFWGIQNEIAMFGEDEMMYQKLAVLDELAKSLDPTRISASANLFCVENDSPLNRVTDAVGYNIYFGWYYGEINDSEDFVERFHQDNPDLKLGITEYGVDCNLAFHAKEPRVKDYSEEFQALYHETVYPLFQSKDYIWGTYVWNLYDFDSEIRDEGGVKYRNCKGLISYDRQIKKDAFYYYKAQWSSEPFVKIAASRFKNRSEQQIEVKVYSNQSEVTLQVNQNCYTAASDNGVFYFEHVSLEAGDNVVTVVSGESRDETVFSYVAESDRSYVFVDPNPGLNVKNWFIDAVEEEKLFPQGKYSIRDSCKDILESEAAMAVITEFSPKLAEQMQERLSLMPLERIISYMKNEVSEEQCKELNARLILLEKV